MQRPVDQRRLDAFAAQSTQDARRPFRLAGMPVVAGIGFVMATELLYWARWPLTGEIIVLMLVALPVYFYYQAKQGWQGFSRDLKGAAWMIAYLPTLALLSWAGSSTFGGHGYLPYGIDLLVVGAIGLAFYLWGSASGWRTPALDRAVQG